MIIGIPFKSHPTLFLSVPSYNSNDPTPIDITASFDGVIYQVTLSSQAITNTIWQEKYFPDFKDDTPEKDYHQRVAILLHLFRLGNQPSTSATYQLIAKEQDGEIKVLVQTQGTLPRTVASFWLRSTNKTNPEIFRDWLEQACVQKSVQSGTKDLDRLRNQLVIIEAQNHQLEVDHREIIEDLNAKFSQALAEKKRRIFELMEDKLPVDYLYGLNHEFAQTEGKLALLKAERKALSKKRKVDVAEVAEGSFEEPNEEIPRRHDNTSPDKNGSVPNLKYELVSSPIATVGVQESKTDSLVEATDVTSDENIVEESQSDTDYGSD